MNKIPGFYWLKTRITLVLQSIGLLQKDTGASMPEPKIIMQDKSEDLSVEITTTEICEGNYVTTSITKTGAHLVKDERKTDSLEMAMLEHDIAVTRLIKKGLTKSEFKTPEVSVRPELNKNNTYLHGAPNFTSMLPGTEE